MTTGICPMCHGCGRKLKDGSGWETVFPGGIPPIQEMYAHIAKNVPNDLYVRCTNCGGGEDVMPNGRVPLREDGTPCMHEYDIIPMSPTSDIHKCKYCRYQYNATKI